MVERETSGDFEYLWDTPDENDGLTSHDQVSDPEAAGDFDYLLDDPDDNLWDQPETPDDVRFDAFNMNTWSFKPAPTPWYRTRQAVTALIATAGAAAAIVVAGVLLVFRGPGDYVEDPAPVNTTAPSTAPAATASSRPPAPPPPPPPLPPPPEAPATPATAGGATTAAATTTAAPATAGGAVNDHRAGAHSADRPTTADQGAGVRGHSHARHQAADQRGAPAASPGQLIDVMVLTN